MSTLYLSVLGSPQILHGESSLSLSSRKGVALLVYLAVEGRPQTRKHLTELLWPENDATHGRAAFRIMLSRLRDTLQTNALPEESPHLLSEGDVLSLDMTNVILDLHVVQQAWNLIQYHSDSVHDEERQCLLERLEQACSVWRGGFLDGFLLHDASAFEDWVRIQHTRWQHRLCRIFDHLALLQEQGGALEQAIATLERWQTLDPLNEDIYRRIMHLSLSTGDRSKTLQTYENLRKILASQLQLEPSPETMGLMQHMQNMQHMQRTSLPAPTTAQHSATSSSLIRPYFLPLIGRQREFGLLLECFHSARQGYMQTLIVEGEAGIGKTRLLSAFLDWLQGQQTESLYARAYETSGRLSYGLFIDAFRRRLDAERAPDDLLADVWLTELSRIFPELRDRYPDLPPAPTEGSEGAGRLFEAIAQLGLALSKRNSLVLVLEDLHWSDAATRDVLAYVVRRWQEQGANILLILTVRSEQVQDTLQTYLLDLVHTLSVQRIMLSLLDEHDVQQAATTLGPIALEGQAIDTEGMVQFGLWLFAETNGHPLFLVQILRDLEERGVLTRRVKNTDGAHVEHEQVVRILTSLKDRIPQHMQDVLRHRLARISPTAFALLVAASVLEQYATFEYLTQVADLDESTALAMLDEMLQSRLLRKANGQRQVIYTLFHDKFRRVVVGEAGEARLRVFHRRAYSLLTEHGAPVSVLAQHAYAAQMVPEMFLQSIAAGDEAMTLFAIQDALAFYEQAKDIFLDERIPSTALPPNTLTFLLHLGRTYELLQRWDEAQHNYELLGTLAAQAHDISIQIMTLNQLARVLAREETNLTHVRSLLAEARKLALTYGNDELLKETQWNEFQQGGAAWDQKALDAWKEHRETRMQEVQNWLLVAQRLTGFAYENPQMTHWGQAQSVAMQVIIWYQQQGNVEMEGYAWSLLAAAQLHYDHIQDACISTRRALHLMEQVENPYGQNIIRAFLAYLIMLQGQLEPAWNLIQDVIVKARRVGFLPQLSADLLVFSDIASHFAHILELAASTSQEGLLLGLRLGSRGDMEIFATQLCYVHTLRGNWEQARIYAEQAQRVRDDYALPLFLTSCQYETETWLGAGQREVVVQALAQFERRIGTSRRYRIALLRSLACLACYDGKLEQAMANLNAALPLAQELGLPMDVWQIQAEQARLFEQMDDPQPAQLAYIQANAGVQALAEKINDKHLRASFLASIPVSRLLRRVEAYAPQEEQDSDHSSR